MQTSITKNTISMLACKEVEGNMWLMADFSVECWEEAHYKVTVSTAIPGLVIWCMVIPVLILILMYKQYKIGRLNQEHNKIRYGYLFNGYKSKFWYWEGIVLYRKLAVYGITVALSQYQ